MKYKTEYKCIGFYFKRFTGMPQLPYTWIYRPLFPGLAYYKLASCTSNFKKKKKKHENENYLKKNLQETFLRIVSKEKWYFVQFCTTDHWLPDILNESRRELFQMVLCQGQNYNAVCCHTQFTTTQRSNAFKLNHYFFFNNQSLFRLQEAEVAAGSCRGLHRDGGEASREDVLLYFLQGCCFFH